MVYIYIWSCTFTVPTCQWSSKWIQSLGLFEPAIDIGGSHMMYKKNPVVMYVKYISYIDIFYVCVKKYTFQLEIERASSSFTVRQTWCFMFMLFLFPHVIPVIPFSCMWTDESHQTVSLVAVSIKSCIVTSAQEGLGLRWHCLWGWRGLRKPFLSKQPKVALQSAGAQKMVAPGVYEHLFPVGWSGAGIHAPGKSVQEAGGDQILGDLVDLWTLHFRMLISECCQIAGKLWNRLRNCVQCGPFHTILGETEWQKNHSSSIRWL